MFKIERTIQGASAREAVGGAKFMAEQGGGVFYRLEQKAKRMMINFLTEVWRECGLPDNGFSLDLEMRSLLYSPTYNNNLQDKGRRFFILSLN